MKRFISIKAVKAIGILSLLFVVATVILLAGDTANAKQKEFCYSSWYKNTTGWTATDFHWNNYASEKIRTDKWMCYIVDPQGNLRGPKLRSYGDNWHTMYLGWYPINVPNQYAAYVYIHIYLQNRGNNTPSAWFTKTGSKDLPSDSAQAPALGFVVDSTGEFSLENGYSQTIHYADLKYLVSDSLLPYSEDSLRVLLGNCAEGTPFNPPGWSSLPDGSVPPNSQTPTLAQLTMAEGQYMAAYCVLSFDDGTNTCYTIVQQGSLADEASIPTLTEWGLIVLVLVLLALGTWVFFKRRKVVGVRL